jgi:hypothetical protein
MNQGPAYFAKSTLATRGTGASSFAKTLPGRKLQTDIAAAVMGRSRLWKDMVLAPGSFWT